MNRVVLRFTFQSPPHSSYFIVFVSSVSLVSSPTKLNNSNQNKTKGPLNTYARAGKLFPGPHLYAGAGLVVLWALAASMVPAMQKGNDTARTVHIGANVAGLGLLAWQVTTGVPILFKVIEFTKWP